LNLALLWTYTPERPPAPSWPLPAAQDWWHNVRELHPAVVFDRAFQVAISSQGLFFGSSGDDSLTCLDPNTGEPGWVFFAGAPIRFSPVLSKGKVYFGSDDGCIYCLSQTDGEQIWKRPIGEKKYWIPGNNRLISLCPVRTGLLVMDDTLYCAAGLFPRQETWLAALDARTGETMWKESLDVSPQGYLLTSNNHLFVPTGRTSPQIYSKETGKKIGAVDTPGGAFAILAEDVLFNAPGRREGQVGMVDSNTRERIALFDGLRVVVDGDRSYLVKKDSITGILRTRFTELSRKQSQVEKQKEMIRNQMKLNKDSKKIQELHKSMVELDREIASLREKIQACTLWEKSCNLPHSLICMKNCLLAGGEGRVVALDKRTGETLWEETVEGNAYGLAVWNNKLYVSTDKGVIHCFGQSSRATQDRAHSSEAKFQEKAEISEHIQGSAQHLLERLDSDRGYALISGEDALPWASVLGTLSRFQIVMDCVEENEAMEARSILNARDTAGRVTVLPGAGRENLLPYGIFNLMILTRGSRIDMELLKLLRPYGGMAVLLDITEPLSKEWVLPNDWTWSREQTTETMSYLIKGSPGRAGTWSHLYGNTANTACSGEPGLSQDLSLQWFGAPGPRRMVDRHHRAMSPLFDQGVLVICGNEFLTAVDAYNGTFLWDKEIPGFLRLGLMNDTGNACIQGGRIYLAAGSSCRVLDLFTGEDLIPYPVHTQQTPSARHWGYIAATEDLLMGSTQRPTASFQDFGWGNSTVGQIEGDFRLQATSDGLFALDRRTGEPLWSRQKGLIQNSAIALDQGLLFFTETNSRDLLEDEDGRISTRDYCKEPIRLVALHAVSGQEVWERSILLPFENVFFLSVYKDLLIATGSYNAGENVEYGFYAFHVLDGSEAWTSSYQTGHKIGGTHGEQWQHPSIIRDMLYLMPFAIHLETGQKVDGFEFGRGGHGCGTVTACANHLYFRGNNPQLFDVTSRELVPINRVTRPGCWINIISAGGLLLLPESSSGCTCAYPLQTSLVYSSR